ncbi:MAG: DUF4214 domain-containing protein [Sphingomonadaceae bacterium]
MPLPSSGLSASPRCASPLYASLAVALILPLTLTGCGAGSSESALAPAPQALKQGAPVRLAAAPAAISFSGYLSQYTVSLATLTVTDNLSGVVTAVPAQGRLQFADVALALDLDGNAGQSYRIYQAAFNRKPDLAGLGYWMGGMDSGATLVQVAQNFIDSGEFSATYGNLNNVAYVTQLYANVLHRTPDQAGLDYHVGYLEGTHPDHLFATRAQTLVTFSESAENKSNVADAIRNGIEFLPTGFAAPVHAPADFAATYTGTFSGADNGPLTLNVDASGVLRASMHANGGNIDLSGSATLGSNGRFAVTMSGANVSIPLVGSINFAQGLATGSWVVSGTTSGGAFNASKPAPVPVPTGPTFATVQAIIMQRCVPCHSAHPTMAGFNPAPLGIQFDTEAQIRGSISDLNTYVVRSKIMPYANLTNMTDAERATIGSWINAGTP